jgi:hypothetical protein
MDCLGVQYGATNAGLFLALYQDVLEMKESTATKKNAKIDLAPINKETRRGRSAGGPSRRFAMRNIHEPKMTYPPAIVSNETARRWAAPRQCELSTHDKVHRQRQSNSGDDGPHRDRGAGARIVAEPVASWHGGQLFQIHVDSQGKNPTSGRPAEEVGGLGEKHAGHILFE